MGKYDEVDKKIIAALSTMPVSVFYIWLSCRDDVRDITVIDRRMQHLKKKGLVKNKRGVGWMLAL